MNNEHTYTKWKSKKNGANERGRNKNKTFSLYLLYRLPTYTDTCFRHHGFRFFTFEWLIKTISKNYDNYLPERIFEGNVNFLCNIYLFKFSSPAKHWWNKFVKYFETFAFPNETTRSVNILRFSFYTRSREICTLFFKFDLMSNF